MLSFTCVFAQSPLDVRLDFDVQDESLESALYLLIVRSEVSISFSNNSIPRNKLVSMNVQQERLEDILKTLLEDTRLKFELVGTQIVLLRKPAPEPKRRFTISGFVENAESGERIIGANVYDDLGEIGTTTNEFGYYSLTLPESTSELMISYLGFQKVTHPLALKRNLTLNFELKPAFLDEVVITSTANRELIQAPQPNSEKLIMENVTRLPSLGGEPDVVRLLYSLPGVQTGADGFGGVSVRGGNVDQNLFLLDGVPVYNPLHGVGIYSIYNSSAIRSATFIKGSFPAKYGGRISSVLDVQTKEGSMKNYVVETDIGLTSGKLTVEGPLIKDKSSFFVSGRRAFLDFYSVPITSRIKRRSGIDGFISYFFYDFNAKLNYKLSKNDRVYLSFYKGGDSFSDINKQSGQIAPDTVFTLSDNQDVFWGNEIGSFRWNHIYGPKLFSNTTFTLSRYFYQLRDFFGLSTVGGSEDILKNDVLVRYNTDNNDLAAKIDFDYRPTKNHQIEFGSSLVRHRFQPGVASFSGAAIDTADLSGVFEKNPLRSFELDFYVQDEMSIGKNFKANLGLRTSAMGFVEKTYVSVQPRLAFQLFPEKKWSFHGAVSKLSQHLHLLSPSSIGLPKDLWVSSTARIKPQKSWQYEAGLDFKPQKGFQIGVEGYYKKMDNLLIFKDVFLTSVNSINWQNKVSIGKGWAYGVEFLLKKQTEKGSGWLSYTFAKSERQFDKEINRGNKFPFRLDRRHNLTLMVLRKIGKRAEFSGSWTFSTGSAFTLPLQEYEIVQSPKEPFPVGVNPIIAQSSRGRNSSRLPNYHRLDFGLNLYFKEKRALHAIRIGAYNAYNRKNPLFIRIRNRLQENGEVTKEVVQVSLLPIFPTLRYNVKFF